MRGGFPCFAFALAVVIAVPASAQLADSAEVTGTKAFLASVARGVVPRGVDLSIFRKNAEARAALSGNELVRSLSSCTITNVADIDMFGAKVGDTYAMVEWSCAGSGALDKKIGGTFHFVEKKMADLQLVVGGIPIVSPPTQLPPQPDAKVN